MHERCEKEFADRMKKVETMSGVICERRIAPRGKEKVCKTRPTMMYGLDVVALTKTTGG